MLNLDAIPSLFKPMSVLTPAEISKCHSIIGEAQPHKIYLNAALEALKRGEDNRWLHFSNSGGLTTGIDFDNLRVFTTVGAIDEDVLYVIARNSRRTEFHVPSEYAVKLKSIAPDRVLREDKLRYYLLKKSVPFIENFEGLRSLNLSDLTIVQTFYDQYDGTIFSSWMLEQAFWGLFHEGRLISAGGTVVTDNVGKAANVGNFLTDKYHRGRGYGRLVVKKLINDLIQKGITTFTLGTTEENFSACRTYESVGFQLIEERVEIEFTEIQ